MHVRAYPEFSITFCYIMTAGRLTDVGKIKGTIRFEKFHSKSANGTFYARWRIIMYIYSNTSRVYFSFILRQFWRRSSDGSLCNASCYLHLMRILPSMITPTCAITWLHRQKYEDDTLSASREHLADDNYMKKSNRLNLVE